MNDLTGIEEQIEALTIGQDNRNEVLELFISAVEVTHHFSDIVRLVVSKGVFPKTVEEFNNEVTKFKSEYLKIKYRDYNDVVRRKNELKGKHLEEDSKEFKEREDLNRKWDNMRGSAFRYIKSVRAKVYGIVEENTPASKASSLNPTPASKPAEKVVTTQKENEEEEIEEAEDEEDAPPRRYPRRKTRGNNLAPQFAKHANAETDEVLQDRGMRALVERFGGIKDLHLIGSLEDVPTEPCKLVVPLSLLLGVNDARFLSCVIGVDAIGKSEEVVGKSEEVIGKSEELIGKSEEVVILKKKKKKVREYVVEIASDNSN